MTGDVMMQINYWICSKI